MFGPPEHRENRERGAADEGTKEAAAVTDSGPDGTASVASDPVTVNRIATPQVTFSGTGVRWAALDGAASYEVALTHNGATVITASTTDTYCALSPWMDAPGAYYATVRAFAGGSALTLDSGVSAPAGPVTRLPQADKPTLAPNGDVTWNGSHLCLVELWQGTTSLTNRSADSSPYNIMSLIEMYGSGTYYVTVEFVSNSESELSGARSVPSDPQTFTLPTPLP